MSVTCCKDFAIEIKLNCVEAVAGVLTALSPHLDSNDGCASTRSVCETHDFTPPNTSPITLQVTSTDFDAALEIVLFGNATSGTWVVDNVPAAGWGLWTITDTGKTWAVNALAGKWAWVHSGTGNTLGNYIESNTAHSFSLRLNAVGYPPDVTTLYYINMACDDDSGGGTNPQICFTPLAVEPYRAIVYNQDYHAFGNYDLNFCCCCPDWTSLPLGSTMQTPIIVGDTVQFTDLTVGNKSAWDWDFGDGSAHSSLQNPTHVYDFQHVVIPWFGQICGLMPVIETVTSGECNLLVTKDRFVIPHRRYRIKDFNPALFDPTAWNAGGPACIPTDISAWDGTFPVYWNDDTVLPPAYCRWTSTDCHLGFCYGLLQPNLDPVNPGFILAIRQATGPADVWFGLKSIGAGQEWRADGVYVNTTANPCATGNPPTVTVEAY